MLRIRDYIDESFNNYTALRVLQEHHHHNPMAYVDAVWKMRYPDDHVPQPKWHWPIISLSDHKEQKEGKAA